MPQIINTNMLSLITQNNLNTSQSQVQTAIEQLSSGKRINSAKDDAAGMAIVNRMSSQINGLTQAQRNSSDGTSIAQTTEGALDQINDNLQRIRTLVVQAKNGTNSSKDKKSIQDEIKQRIAEINRVSSQTEFNGIKVLDKDQKITIQVGADDGQTIDIDLHQLDSSTLGLDDLEVDNLDPKSLTQVTGDIDEQKAPDLSKITTLGIDGKTGTDTATGLYKDKNGQYYVESDKGNYYTATVDKDGNVTVDDNNQQVTKPPKGLKKVNKLDIKITPDTKGLPNGSELMQGTDDNGKTVYYIKNQDGTYDSADIDATGKVTDGGQVKTNTKNPLKLIDKAIAQVDDQRSELGAVQNRFESVNESTQSATQNLTASQSRIQDTDYAASDSSLTRAQVIQQAGMAVLSQANQQPNLVLKLLQ